MRVAVLGVGRMGAAIAARLREAGHELALWNRTPAALEPFAASGARLLECPADAWGEADVCILSLSDSAAVESVCGGEDGLLNAAVSGTLVETSTIDPAASARIAATAARSGVAYLRAPITGNPGVIAAGNAGFIVSGERTVFEAVKPLLASVAPNLFYVGEGERARVVKLAVNLVLAGTTELLAEALVLGERHEIGRAEMLEVIGNSALGSPFVRYKTEALVGDDYTPTFSTRLLGKDVGLALAAAGESTPLPLAEATRALIEECVRDGEGELDFIALLPRLRRAAGLS